MLKKSPFFVLKIKYSYFEVFLIQFAGGLIYGDNTKNRYDHDASSLNTTSSQEVHNSLETVKLFPRFSVSIYRF